MCFWKTVEIDLLHKDFFFHERDHSLKTFLFLIFFAMFTCLSLFWLAENVQWIFEKSACNVIQIKQ